MDMDLRMNENCFWAIFYSLLTTVIIVFIVSMCNYNTKKNEIIAEVIGKGADPIAVCVGFGKAFNTNDAVILNANKKDK